MRHLAAAMLLAEIVIHVYLAPDHLHEVPYIGVSFVLASVLLTVALVAILVAPRRPSGWLLGAALCVGMAGAFVISRVTGLPDYHEAWTSDHALGLISLPPEAVFVLCALLARRRYAATNSADTAAGSRATARISATSATGRTSSAASTSAGTSSRSGSLRAGMKTVDSPAR
jgi:hypothetical protein